MAFYALDETSTVSKEVVNSTVGELIYIASNGRGKRRSKISQLPDLQWRSIVFVTGEYSLDDLQTRKRGSGQDARLITLGVRGTSEGGIFHGGNLSEAQLADRCRKLAEVAQAYTGNEYQGWIEKIAARGRSAIGTIMQTSIDNYVGKLVDTHDSNLTRTLAAKFAAFAVTGDALISAGILEWPKGFPLKVATRVFRADLAGKQTAASATSLPVQNCAQRILARLHVDHLNECPHESGVHVRTEKGQKQLVIPKGACAAWLREDEKPLYEALQSHTGLLRGRDGKNSYAQIMLGGNRRQSAMVIDLSKLAAVAFASTGA